MCAQSGLSSKRGALVWMGGSCIEFGTRQGVQSMCLLVSLGMSSLCEVCVGAHMVQTVCSIRSSNQQGSIVQQFPYIAGSQSAALAAFASRTAGRVAWIAERSFAQQCLCLFP